MNHFDEDLLATIALCIVALAIAYFLIVFA